MGSAELTLKMSLPALGKDKFKMKSVSYFTILAPLEMNGKQYAARASCAITLTTHNYAHDNLVQDFWNWSWDEMAAYDLPAVLGFVYLQTGSKIVYIGHSQVTINV